MIRRRAPHHGEKSPFLFSLRRDMRDGKEPWRMLCGLTVDKFHGLGRLDT